MVDAGTCDMAASCLCGAIDLPASNLPASAVLEATVTTAFIAEVTMVYGTTTAFAVGDTVCVDQSEVGATILIPVQNGGDAAQVVLPPPDGGTCVPNYAYTVLLDDAGRPMACDGPQASLKLAPMDVVNALEAPSCSASLESVDPGWSQSDCGLLAGGCSVGRAPLEAGLVVLVAVGASWLARRLRAPSAWR